MFIPSLFLGGALGAVVTLILGMSVPTVIVGACIGACVAWVAYDPMQIVRSAPRVAKETLDLVSVHVSKKDILDLLKFPFRPRLPLYAFAAMAYAMYRSRYWEWSEIAGVIGTSIITLHSIVVWWVVGSATSSPEGQETGPLMRRLGVPKYKDLVVSLNDHITVGADWTRRDIRRQIVDTMRYIVAPYVIAVELVMYAVGAVIATAFFLAALYVILQLIVPMALVVLSCIGSYKLFVLVHSEKRRMVFVDSGLGVLVSYATLRWQFDTAFVESSPLTQLSFVLLGGACAVVLGVVNHEIVSRRLLKLNPV